MSQPTPVRRPANRRHLRVLGGDGRGCAVDGGLVRAVQRPGDRHDVWLIDPLDAAARGRITAGAVAAHVSVEIAASLVIQRLITTSDLHDVFTDDAPRLVAELDDQAAVARVRRAVSPAYAAYVRALRTIDATGVLSTSIPLPVRVIERIGDVPLSIDVAAIDVGAAVSWECAAALSGQTMPEWAAFSAARMSRV